VRVSQRLTAALLVGICGIFGLHAYAGLRFHEQLYTTDVRRDHDLIGRNLAPAVAALWSDRGRERALEFIGSANEREAELQVRWVRGEDGFAEDGSAARLDARDLERLRRGEDVFRIEQATPPDGRVALFVPVVVSGEFVGALEISESLSAQREYMYSRLIRNGVTTLLMVALGGALSWFLGDRLVARPVRLLTEKARRIGEGDFAHPIELSRPDEFSELADALNATASRLETARGRLEAETSARIRAIEQLRHADRLTTVGRLAAGIAHELGTPLNVVAECAKMIEGGEVATAEELRENAQIIHRQAQRMSLIIRQLMDFARSSTSERHRIDLCELARATGVLMKPMLDRARVSLALEPAEQPVWSAVDPGQIQQVLTNLLANAIDVSPRGGEVRVRIESCEGEVGGCRIVVADRGPGIPADVLPQIFDPFFTTKRVGEGTGLGLAVADGIVRDHQGRLEVESGPGGSRFILWLPAS